MAVGGYSIMFDRMKAGTIEPGISASAEPTIHVGVGMLVCRRQLFDKVGTFDPELLFAEDIDFFMRLRDHQMTLFFVRATVLYVRLHGNSMMASNKSRKQSDLRRAVMNSISLKSIFQFRHFTPTISLPMSYTIDSSIIFLPLGILKLC